MSGIAGLLRRDSAPATREDLERMAARIAHRGPDGVRTWSTTGTGLVQLTSWNTPGASRDQGLSHACDDGPAITAEVRLDNREELLDELGLSRADTTPDDASLILLAYRRWGPDCAGHLIGDFAFAIWDPERSELFCARDAFGVRPFYYFDSERLFAFGSEIKAIFALAEVPVERDELNIGLFLEGVALDQGGTLFEGVRRLPPGCCLRARDRRLTISRYYQVLDTPRLPRATDAEYIEEYAHRFRTAVRDRLVGDRRVGSMLSGGLDSSSIVCAAREQLSANGGDPFPTISVLFDEIKASDESSYIEAVLEGGALEPHFLQGDQLAPFAEWEDVLRCLDEPSYGANLFLNRAVYRAAREANVAVLLDGFDGDAVVGYGFERLAELARRVQLPTLVREIYATARVLDLSPRRVFRVYVRRPLVRSWRQQAPAPLKSLYRRVRGRPRDGVRALLKTTRGDFAARVGLQERIRELEDGNAALLREAGLSDDHGLASGRQAVILEILDKVAAANNIECRYPFFDRRLVEYALGLPARMRLRRGYTRYVHRVACPELPEKVGWRSWKGDLSHNFIHTFRKYDSGRLESLISDPGDPVYEYVDRVKLAACLEGFQVRGDDSDAFELSKATSLSTWLGLLAARDRRSWE